MELEAVGYSSEGESDGSGPSDEMNRGRQAGCCTRTPQTKLLTITGFDGSYAVFDAPNIILFGVDDDSAVVTYHYNFTVRRKGAHTLCRSLAASALISIIEHHT
jgi:hypothetical protein